jgi:glycosyltransferase involved in cell wall biosynthesis
MRPLRVVLLMLEPPLPFGNAAARWYYVLLRGLVERGHRVTAFAACSKEEDIPRAAEVFPAPTYDLRCYRFPDRRGWAEKLRTFRRPFSYMFAPELLGSMRAELERGFDVLHLEQLWCGWAALPWRDRALVNVHFLHAIDLEEAPPVGWRGAVERWLMRRGERRLLRGFSHFRTLSERLADRLRTVNPAADVSVIPIGLDPSLYPYMPDESRTGEPVVSVIGNMNWYPSRSAAERLLTRLWPAIRRQVPEARVQVVGWNARQALASHLDGPGVTVEENVPDIRPIFERTGVLLYAPARGSGMKIKVLEALAFGVPVVTTSEGVEGLPAEDGVHAGVCDDDAGLVERTVRLLRDPAAANRQRGHGHTLLEEHCGPGPTLDALEVVYERLAREERPECGRTADSLQGARVGSEAGRIPRTRDCP